VVVAVERHWRLSPGLFIGVAVEKTCIQHIVPVGEDVSLDVDDIAHNALDRKTPRVDLWCDVLDYNSGRGDFRVDRGWQGRSFANEALFDTRAKNGRSIAAAGFAAQWV
jgi:hypothetical protein